MRFPVMRTGLVKAKVAIALVATAGLMAGAEVLAGEPPPGGAGSAAMQEGPGRPRIVQVVPADGATGIDPVTEIRIRFDRPMDPTRMVLEWAWGDAGFRLRGDVRYSADTHEFIIPVQLTPGAQHRITSGREHPIRPGAFEGFESADHVVADPRAWSFTTAKPEAGGGPPPRLVSVSPPPDVEVARVTRLDLTFDRPMDPAGYGFRLVDPDGIDRQVALIGRADYDRATHRFAMWMSLPANWNGELALRGFRGQDGVEAEPIMLKYRTRRRVLSESVRPEGEGADPSSEVLRRLVEKVRDARRKLTSVSEEVLTTAIVGPSSPDWYQRLDAQGSRFAMQGDRKFSGEVDALMGTPLRVGSDGERCWWRGVEIEAIVPFEDVADKNLAICDAFDANGPADAARIIRDRRLEYVGEAVVRGRPCHRIRSWNLENLENGIGTILEWSIDSDTFLPARVEVVLVGLCPSSHTIDFTYSRVNQPIPVEAFRPETDPAAPRSNRVSGTLPEGYTRRFLTVKDGSDGRISVRWGMTGPKGAMSGGLN